MTDLEKVDEDLKALAQAQLDLTQFVSLKNDISEALVTLSQEFTKVSRKLSSNHIQLIIDFLSNADNVTIFLTLSKQSEMEEHRDRWLERLAEVDVNQVEQEIVTD